jgi:hypothetical protein
LAGSGKPRLEIECLVRCLLSRRPICIGGKEIARGRFVADGDDAKLLEFGEGVLDRLTCFVGISIEVAGRSAVRVG